MATLVARGEPPSAVFAASCRGGWPRYPRCRRRLGRSLRPRRGVDRVCRRVGALLASLASLGAVCLLGVTTWPLLYSKAMSRHVLIEFLRTMTPATSLARNWAHSSAGAPIDVEGRLWGVLTVGGVHEDELPPGTEYRLAQFAELVASAISNSQARGELGRVADEQAALRRVATLVAEAAPRQPCSHPSRRRSVASSTSTPPRCGGISRTAPREIVASWSQRGRSHTGRAPGSARRGTVTAIVRETGRPARVDQYTDEAGGAAREIGIRSTVGVPITVEGELWGLIAVVSTSEEPPPPGTEERLAGFTELVATAIANAQAREELRTIADEQAALRRVATLVAQRATARGGLRGSGRGGRPPARRRGRVRGPIRAGRAVNDRRLEATPTKPLPVGSAHAGAPRRA